MHVAADTNFHSFSNIHRHALHNVSMDKIVQEDTFLSWFSQIDIPVDAYTLVAEEISECAYDMVYDEKYKDLSVLTIRVEFVVTRSAEDDDCEDEENPSFEEDQEVMEVEEEENGLVAIEGEGDDEDDYDYEVDYGLEEVEEDMMAAEEYNWFTPAAKSCVEELDTVNVEEATQCTAAVVLCAGDAALLSDSPTSFQQVRLNLQLKKTLQSYSSAAEHRGKVDAIEHAALAAACASTDRPTSLA
ncbi:E3 ubiquitin-protein ligase RNF181 [Trifolium pratense]|uniref:E3 ubiquitin-protein ligase RNF181 n=1 Tax=Trifolium pratense TaxID=57577 RepID=A0A2K3N4Y3_TRIPR|nr:E3 ubiquitin-protein ligase RNF181 [Trifolium pratense]